MSTVTAWYVYILRCADNSLYTGITTQLQRRLHEHNHGDQAARYTRGRRPLELIYWENHTSRSLAAQREANIKKLTRRHKLELIRLGNRQALAPDEL